MLKIGVSGHRQLDDIDHVRAAIKQHIEQLLSEKGATGFEAYSGLAVGADTIFAQVALELGGTLKVVLPFPQEAYEEDFGDAGDKTEFLRLLEHDPHPILNNERIPANQDERNEDYLAYGKRVVDESDILVLIWDGQEAAGKGGTAEIAKYAQSKNQEIIRIIAYRNELSKHYILCDTEAIRQKAKYERRWIFAIVLGFIAALILAASLSIKNVEHKEWMATVELGCILATLVIILYLKRGKLNKKRLNLRREAERFRVLERMVPGKFDIRKITKFPEMSKEGKRLEEKFIELNPVGQDFDKAKEQLMDLIDDQISYHGNTRPKIDRKRFGRLKPFQFPLLIAFSTAVFIHTGSIWLEHNGVHDSWLNWMHGLSLFCCLSIPPAYAAIENYIYFKEYHKILRDSEQMANLLKNRKEDLQNLTSATPNALQELNSLATNIRDSMDKEISEWYATMEEKHNPGVT